LTEDLFQPSASFSQPPTAPLFHVEFCSSLVLEAFAQLSNALSECLESANAALPPHGPLAVEGVSLTEDLFQPSPSFSQPPAAPLFHVEFCSLLVLEAFAQLSKALSECLESANAALPPHGSAFCSLSA